MLHENTTVPSIVSKEREKVSPVIFQKSPDSIIIRIRILVSIKMITSYIWEVWYAARWWRRHHIVCVERSAAKVIFVSIIPIILGGAIFALTIAYLRICMLIFVWKAASSIWSSPSWSRWRWGWPAVTTAARPPPMTAARDSCAASWKQKLKD